MKRAKKGAKPKHAPGTWNHRIVRRVHPANNLRPAEETFGVHEAHYKAGETEPHAITMEPVTLSGESVTALQWQVQKIAEAFAKPVLDYDTRKPIGIFPVTAQPTRLGFVKPWRPAR